MSEDRIVVSCRLPGGLILTVRIYSDKLIRQLKSYILRRQKRFLSEDQFDLYLQNGKKLGGLDEPLRLSGIRDRSLVQVVSSRMAPTQLKEPSPSLQATTNTTSKTTLLGESDSLRASS